MGTSICFSKRRTIMKIMKYIFYIMIAGGHTCFDALYVLYIRSLVVESLILILVLIGRLE